MLLMAATVAVRRGQTADGSQPAPSNVRASQYPRIHPDLRVSFQLKAPEAKKVEVSVAGSHSDMTRNNEGVWTATVPPQVPGFHYYWFIVDGLQVNDPGSQSYFGYVRSTSGHRHSRERRRLLRIQERAAWRGTFASLLVKNNGEVSALSHLHPS
jgi:1,4-alpha-glucan branching enzyme